MEVPRDADVFGRGSHMKKRVGRPPRVMTPRRKAAAEAFYREDVPLKEIARRLGILEATVYAWLRKQPFYRGKVKKEYPLRYMSDGELRQSYRLAKDPEAQITVLAELNGMSKADVRTIVAGCR